MSVTPENSEVMVLFSSDAVDSAKDEKMENWIKNKVYEEVDKFTPLKSTA